MKKAYKVGDRVKTSATLIMSDFRLPNKTGTVVAVLGKVCTVYHDNIGFGSAANYSFEELTHIK